MLSCVAQLDFKQMSTCGAQPDFKLGYSKCVTMEDKDVYGRYTGASTLLMPA